MKGESLAQIYLSIGSNMGDRRKYLKYAVERLSARLDSVKVSSLYATEPWGNTEQPEFLNLCLSGKTSSSPEELLELTRSIEKSLGRTHQEKWGPREIDIDILFYDNAIIKTAALEIPHPYVSERAFVLIPLNEIAPDLIHPVLKVSISKLAAETGPSGVRKLADEKF
jgi:2-amino-4-hydroxy-6-hydroxymethyldihydropteridine diphosphokinase